MQAEPSKTFRLPLWRGGRVAAYALVDPADFKEACDETWRLSDQGYAFTQIRLAPGRWRNVYLHRILLGLERGNPLQSDHINRDRLDNRRANLRAVDADANRQNRSGWGKSQYRGVFLDRGTWRAAVRKNGKRTYLGTFATEREAAEAAETFRRAHMPYAHPDVELP